jgi:hypothetical protein
MWRRTEKANPTLLDAAAAHREHPRTYSIPRRIVRESLTPGDFVKLLFKVDPPSNSVEVERMSVEVVTSAHGVYTGRLADLPRYFPGLQRGALIEFRPEHVAAREAQLGDPLYTDTNAFAVVSRRVWEEDAWPARLERREIADPQFSGWFVFAGDETDGYPADPTNFVPVAQATLFDKFRVLDSGLEGPSGTTMVWSDDNAEYAAPA